jgi:hypothetical protein
MVGDYVAYSGNLYKIDPNAPVTLKAPLIF